MTPAQLSRTVLRAMRRAVDAGELTATVPQDAHVERPRPGGTGDYATNLALRIAGEAGAPPRRVAEVISAHLTAEPGIARADVTGPGFVSITLAPHSTPAVVADIRERGERYGHVAPGTGALVQLHTPHELRALVVADAARRILRSQGVDVRVTSDEQPDERWVELAGVRVDAYGSPSMPSTSPRPSAAPTSPALSTPPTTLRPVPPPPGAPDPLALGPDAARWALLHPAPHDRPHTGPEHLVQHESNPLFRIRYAYARTRALTRNAADLGFTAAPGETDASAHDLLGALGDHPTVLATAARRHAPDRLTRHLVRTADAFLAQAHTVLPLGDEKPSAAHRSRLALAEATGTVLAGGLSLLGISAPEYL
ncbi:ArgS-related anticodon-binding protein NrtL [Streptomyces flavofungini]|uniref:ArgS-related anticodon-binding protein NrtL n=1 Tax=Streptomyces flavofungini TaxID=68200 RepID=UPI0025AF9D52|nr:DALR anticodon-binding domain-containing protein [Streptomyces flavofungini]WJV46193.1 DALR anticodon-binding domain-containing protein [Streptomyces flavofungini]